MPMKKSSVSSHLIKTVFVQNFILSWKKKKKDSGRVENLVLSGGNCDDSRARNREEKLELPKQKGQGRDMMVIKHGMKGLTLMCKAVVRQDGNKDALECVFP